ncbi:MAG: sulfotransferase [Chitinophagales bacterium]|nr:sulfotransferase [Chitinophagales bacterium]
MEQHHPNFFLIGTVKGGTTSLFHYLSQHSEIYLSPIKEVNYFSRKDIDETKFSKDYRHDIHIDLKKYFEEGMSYPVHIAHITNEEDYLHLFSKVRNEKAIGEMSLSYMLYENTPKEIYKAYPQAKILAILRNPAERAFSQYVMNLKQGKILENDFLKEIVEDDKRQVKGWGANHQYLMIGKYYEQLKRYYDIFPKDQIKVFLFDDFKTNPNAVVKEMFDFLAVDSNLEIDTSKKVNEGGVPKLKKINYFLNQTGIISWAKNNLPRSWRTPFKKWMYKTDEKAVPAMSLDERKFLITYYKEDILLLEKLINRDLKAWLTI